jgi:hypothetical protein
MRILGYYARNNKEENSSPFFRLFSEKLAKSEDKRERMRRNLSYIKKY